MSLPRICLSRYPDAPATTACTSASSSENEVSMRHATSPWSERISRQTAIAVAVGQPHVEDGDVGPGRRDPGERPLGGVGFADDLDVVLGVEQLPDPAADDLVVVEQEHADHVATAHAGSLPVTPAPPLRSAGQRRRCDARA